MKLSYHWLSDYIPDIPNPDHLSNLLTNLGLEVESMESFTTIPGNLESLIIGHTLSVLPHPNADRLKICSVDIGNESPLSIVCGAPNVEADQKVIVAPVGSKVHPVHGDSFLISRSKIRGEWSEGMLCAEDEIGLGSSHEGIKILPQDWAVGKPLTHYIQPYQDWVFEIGITPNRSDALSHRGSARDVLAFLKLQQVKSEIKIENSSPKAPLNPLTKLSLNPPSKLSITYSSKFYVNDKANPSLISPNQQGSNTFTNSSFTSPINSSKTSATRPPIKIRIQDHEKCIRFCGITMEGIKVAPSPDWLINRLLALGIRPINNIVDITNFVCQDLGQPLHAYDADFIEGGLIQARSSKQGEEVMLLDGQKRILEIRDLVISDEKKVLGLAGIMGGKESSITDGTQRIFLESACFNATSVRNTSKRLNLKTEASFRFERGMDPELASEALKLAINLVIDLAGGESLSEFIDLYPVPIERPKVLLRKSRILQILGQSMEDEEVESILTGLGIIILHKSKDAWELEVPLFKVDVKREIDVIEELLRVYGLNNIHIPSLSRISLPAVEKYNPENLKEEISQFLTAIGFHEIQTNSLVSSSLNIPVDLLEVELKAQAVMVIHPLSLDTDMLRTSMLSSMLRSVEYNINRKIQNLRLYEFGKIYYKSEETYVEPKKLSLICSGQKQEENWMNSKFDPLTIYDLKGTVDLLFKKLGIPIYYRESENPGIFKTGLVAYRKINNSVEALVRFGELKSGFLEKFNIEKSLFYAEFEWDIILKGYEEVHKNKPFSMKEVSKYPIVQRDLSIIIDQAMEFENIKEMVLKVKIGILKEIHIFDIYEGNRIPMGKKSYSLRFILQDTQKTLMDNEIEKTMKLIIQTLQKEAEAEIPSLG